MIKDKFNEIYNSIMLPVAKKAGLQGFEGLSDDLYREYEDIRVKAKERMLKKNESRMDRHKIASCMTYAILFQTKTLIFCNESDAKDFASRITREGFALIIGVLIMFYMDPPKTEEKALIVPRLKNDNYLMTIVKYLHFSCRNEEFHVFMLANIFFMIETHHRAIDYMRSVIKD